LIAAQSITVCPKQKKYGYWSNTQYQNINLFCFNSLYFYCTLTAINHWQHLFSIYFAS